MWTLININNEICAPGEKIISNTGKLIILKEVNKMGNDYITMIERLLNGCADISEIEGDEEDE